MQIYPVSGLEKRHDYRFRWVKIGDVNGTVAPSELKNAEIRTARSLVLHIEEQKFDAENQIRIPITAANFNQISGYQFTLGFDQKCLKS